MTRALRVQDRIWRGQGQAGRVLGAECVLYRAAGPADPLQDANVVMKLHAAFVPAEGGWNASPGYGRATWEGIFDGAYAKPGDFLRRRETRAGAGDGGIWFLAAQPLLLPNLCVRATRIVDLQRPAAAQAAGVNDYGGGSTTGTTALLSGWPAAVLDAGSGGAYQADLPTGTSLGAWTVLVSGFGGVTLRAGDHMTDDLGRTGVVTAAELSELGWRLHVVQAAA